MSLLNKPADYTASVPTVDDFNILKNRIYDDYGTTANLQGSISNANIAVSAAIQKSKIADTAVVCGNTVDAGSQTITRTTVFSSENLSTSLGTGATAVLATGVLNSNVTAVGNVGISGPDDLISYTLPANTLTTSARGVRVTAWGITASTANTKVLRLMFGANAVVTSPTLTASVAWRWRISAIIVRTGLNTQDVYGEFFAAPAAGVVVGSAANTTTGNFAASADFNARTETETGTIVIKGQTTTTTGTDDVIQEGLLVEMI